MGNILRTRTPAICLAPLSPKASATKNSNMESQPKAAQAQVNNTFHRLGGNFFVSMCVSWPTHKLCRRVGEGKNEGGCLLGGYDEMPPELGRQQRIVLRFYSWDWFLFRLSQTSSGCLLVFTKMFPSPKFMISMGLR